eukprot:CAMPEP_0113938088 /NCGR_PEP_ID=MMETSP1339-20121228/4497_1 /TAXON_ID=94617 /ORGANISM="Fibrocapsa japonica" /LENGTH=647 /DNA_ID=CAMNT_0000941025 /DNA_START=137 /DNA_END=2080 /DNA_ORIENTATION=+ /assembly_acc=CAM_ASM_000762
MLRVAHILSFLGVLGICHGLFYLPGVPPQSFQNREQVKLFVNKLTSTKTQVPFDYYHLPWCHPHIHHESENLGEMLTGDRIENSLYKLEMKVPEACEKVCRKTMSDAELSRFRWAINEEYRVHWIVDNLPASTLIFNPDMPSKPYYVRGFPVGFRVEDPETRTVNHYIYNHIRIIVSFNEDPQEDPTKKVFKGSRIVGLRVEPYSVKHEWDKTEAYSPDVVLTTCNEVNSPANHMSMDQTKYQSVENGNSDIVFTYDIVWEPSETEWAHRWDVYLRGSPNEQVHWFSITNSTLIVLFLTIMVAMILVRALRRDIAEYNETSLEDAKEETGWKLVHGDVFRPPRQMPMLLSALHGTGVQLLGMAAILLTFALLGFLSPANRGSLLTAFVLLFVFLGSVAGYYSARLYKMFRGTDFKNNTMLTALLFPGTCFGIFFVIDIFLWQADSTGAVPFGTLFTLLVLWLGVSTPLVVVGSYCGYRRETSQHPVRTNSIPRQIPPQAWYMHPAVSFFLAGVLPFGAVSVELFFIMSALWLHQIYYIFGFLTLAFLILFATCAEVTIVFCYFQLCNEDYRWWWQCFLNSGSCAVYLFVYGIWYFASQLDMDGIVGAVVYFGYMLIISMFFFLLTGAVGFSSAYWFVSKIYGSIKVD